MDKDKLTDLIREWYDLATSENLDLENLKSLYEVIEESKFGVENECNIVYLSLLMEKGAKSIALNRKVDGKYKHSVNYEGKVFVADTINKNDDLVKIAKKYSK